jgi:hypothetical protein
MLVVLIVAGAGDGGAKIHHAVVVFTPFHRMERRKLDARGRLDVLSTTLQRLYIHALVLGHLDHEQSILVLGSQKAELTHQILIPIVTRWVTALEQD